MENVCFEPNGPAAIEMKEADQRGNDFNMNISPGEVHNYLGDLQDPMLSYSRNSCLIVIPHNDSARLKKVYRLHDG